MWMARQDNGCVAIFFDDPDDRAKFENREFQDWLAETLTVVFRASFYDSEMIVVANDDEAFLLKMRW